MGGDDALPHEEAVILKELVVLLRILLALVQQETDHPLLQNVAKLPGATGSLLELLRSELRIILLKMWGWLRT